MPSNAHRSHNRERCAFLFVFNYAVNSTYHLSNLSTQHPQYQNQPRGSLPFSTVDQFPLTHKMKNPGTRTCPLIGPDSRKFLVFYTFSLFYSLTFDINTTHSTVLPDSHKTYSFNFFNVSAYFLYPATVSRKSF